MRSSIPSSAVVALGLWLSTGQAFAFTTNVDPTTRTIRIVFEGLPTYQQIRLEGVTALSWCDCPDPGNPTSRRSSGFAVDGADLEMQYLGPLLAPRNNFVRYRYLEGFALAGFEQVDWAVIGRTNGFEQRLTGQRPILIAIPEPGSAMLSALGLAWLGMTRRPDALSFA